MDITGVNQKRKRGYEDDDDVSKTLLKGKYFDLSLKEIYYIPVNILKLKRNEKHI